MSEKTTRAATTATSDALDGLLRHYEVAPSQLMATADALYDRHLLFDNVADPAAAGPRERYEALARSVRDILSQRWVRTDQTWPALRVRHVPAGARVVRPDDRHVGHPGVHGHHQRSQLRQIFE